MVGSEESIPPEKVPGRVERSVSLISDLFSLLIEKVTKKCAACFSSLKRFYFFLFEKFSRTLANILNFFRITTKIYFFSFFFGFALFFLIVAGLCALAVVNTVSSAAVRYLWLKDVPGNGLISLSFNALPLITEWWRSDALDKAVNYYLPPSEDSFMQMGLKSEENENNFVDPKPSALVKTVRKSQFEGVHSMTVASTVLAKASDIKISLLRQHVDSIVATSTLLIPSHTRISGRPSVGPMGFSSIYSSSGEVNPDLLFKAPADPFFTREAEYAGSVQLIFLKEAVGFEAVLVVDYSILYAAEEGGKRAGPAEEEDEWLLPNLKVLFRDTQTVHIRTGPPLRPWWEKLMYNYFGSLFYIPLWVYRYLYYIALDYENAAFPFIDGFREVAVVVPLYQRFTPPAPIRDRLRAINFTIYQAQASQEERKARLSRWMFHSSIQLTGMAYYLREYPLISFAFLFIFFGLVYSTGAIVAVLLVVWKGYWKKPSTRGRERWVASPVDYMRDAYSERDEDGRARTPRTDSSSSNSRSSSSASRFSSSQIRASYPDSHSQEPERTKNGKTVFRERQRATRKEERTDKENIERRRNINQEEVTSDSEEKKDK